MRIDTTNGDFAKTIGSGLTGAMRRAMIRTAQRMLQDINTQLIPGEPHPPVDRGIYRAGWRVEEVAGVVYLVNTVKHALFIEKGVRAANVKIGRKMIDALADWAKRKGIANAQAAKTKKSSASFLSVSANPYRKAAWAIAKSMAKKGIFNSSSREGMRIGERAVLKFRDYFPREFNAALKSGGK